MPRRPHATEHLVRDTVQTAMNNDSVPVVPWPDASRRFAKLPASDARVSMVPTGGRHSNVTNIHERR